MNQEVNDNGEHCGPLNQLNRVLRKRKPSDIPRNFFTKVYTKKGSFAQEDSARKSVLSESRKNVEDSKDADNSNDLLFEDQARSLLEGLLSKGQKPFFTKFAKNRKQSKAIQTFRVKKLKELLNSGKLSLLLESKSFPWTMTVQNRKTPKSAKRSLCASNRIRYSNGTFAQKSGVEDCKTSLLGTTAAGTTRVPSETSIIGGAFPQMEPNSVPPEFNVNSLSHLQEISQYMSLEKNLNDSFNYIDKQNLTPSACMQTSGPSQFQNPGQNSDDLLTFENYHYNRIDDFDDPSLGNNEHISETLLDGISLKYNHFDSV